MKSIPTDEAIRLGMLIEYLRGISSVSVTATTLLDDLPELNANFAGNRYRVMDVAEEVKELIDILEKYECEDTLAVVGDLGEKLKQMEEYLSSSPSADEAFLLNPFANDLIAIANEVGDKIMEEAA